MCSVGMWNVRVNSHSIHCYSWKDSQGWAGPNGLCSLHFKDINKPPSRSDVPRPLSLSPALSRDILTRTSLPGSSVRDSFFE
jgi:hypothetical protein